MKKIILILLLIFISNSVFAQDYILKSSLDSSVVEYAHIAFLNVKDGTYSNEKGVFTIPQNVDSIYISHISFENKLVLRKDFEKTIFLTASENSLASIEIRPKKKNKKYKLPKESHKIGLHLSSFEQGTTFIEKNQEKNSYLTTIACPVKKGIDFPIVKINVYSFDVKNNLPDSLIWSSLVKETDYDKNRIILSGLNIKLEKQKKYFISLELVGYKEGSKSVFTKNGKHKRILTIYCFEDKSQTSFITTKNVAGIWILHSSMFTTIESEYMRDTVPVFWLEIE